MRRTTSRCRPRCDESTPGSAGRRDSVLPGLAVVAVATAVAFGIAHLVPALNPSTVAVVIGALVVNVRLHRPVLHPGTHLAAHRFLRVAVVLLGLQLAVGTFVDLGPGVVVMVLVTVTITFTGTRLLGRLLGVSRERSLLVATGFSVCGASAVAAMDEVSDGDESDVAVSVALVTLCGSIAIFALPALQGPLGLDPVAFGGWVGASVHDVGQTVATADRVPGALTTAVVVKLSRVALLAPLVVGVALARSRRARAAGSSVSTGRRPPLLPLFVVGFLAAIAVRSVGVLPTSVLDAAASGQEVLLTAALVGLGTGIDVVVLRRTGGRALVLGLASWLLIGVVAFCGVKLIGL